MSDWLDIEPEDETTSNLPALPLGPKAIDAAVTAAEKRQQFIDAWDSLTDKQRVFLNAWRACRFNANKAIRMLAETAHHTSRNTICKWTADPAFEHARTVLRDASIEEILSKGNLVARQDDIVETLMTPKPILYQGRHTGFTEIDGSAAARANETLLKVGGHLKDKEIDLNVGIIGPQFMIQVVQKDGSVIDATPKGVTIDLPTPEVVDAEWFE